MGKKISGAKRREVNELRAAAAVSGRMEGILFGRVIKLLGNGQVHVMIDSGRNGLKTLLVRLPRLFSRKGATPLNSSSIVSIFVGKEFNTDTDLKPGEAVVTEYDFDITSIIDEKSAHKLVKDGEIPEWMIKSGATDKSELVKDEAFLFTKEDSDSEEEADADGGAGAAAPSGVLKIVAPKGTSGRDKSTVSRLEFGDAVNIDAI